HSENFRDYWWRIDVSGPYYLKEFRGGDYYELREDYWYPNEWDSPNQDFILHRQGIEEAKYNAFNATDNNPKQKPTEYYINHLNYTWDWSLYNMDSLDSGNIDLIPSWQLNPDEMSNLFSNPNIATTNKLARNSGHYLMFNFKNNEDIRKLNVRKAIAHAINKQELVTALGNLAHPEDSIVWTNQIQFYKDDWAIDYDYAKARDFMWDMGYDAAETNEFLLAKPLPHVATDLSIITEGLSLLMPVEIIFTLTITVFYLKKRNR
ncbi:MAG: ABC transporter substrate-binding protein, partial [Candidatus Kariarchaeaceae archaeon]